MEKAFDFFKVLCKALFDFVLENKALVAGVMAVVGLVGFINNVNNETLEQQQRAEIREMCVEQQPGMSWTKDNDLDSMAHTTLSEITSLGNMVIDVSVLGMGQSGTAGEAAEMVFNHLDNDVKRKYKLVYADTGKKVRTLKIDVGDIALLDFLYDDNKVKFTFDESEYYEAMSGMTDTRLVYSCIEDPSIAKISGGMITGVSKGKTKLLICNDRYIWEYTIKVK